MAKEGGEGLGGWPIKLTGLLGLVSLLICAGCATQPSEAWSRTDLALAYADRGLVLKSDGAVTLSGSDACAGPFPSTADLHHCLARHQALILPALPADADFTALARQQRLFAAGEYLTWSGQVAHFPDRTRSQSASDAAMVHYQRLAPPRKHQPLPINAAKIILQ